MSRGGGACGDRNRRVRRTPEAALAALGLHFIVEMPISVRAGGIDRSGEIDVGNLLEI